MNINQTLQYLRTTIAPLSPRHRRWKQFLRDLPLDINQLPRPLANPTVQDFIICGSPRTGTTLLSGFLFQPPNVLTVMEPWSGMRLPPASLFAKIRYEIETTGTLQQGKLDIEALFEKKVVSWCQEGTPQPLLQVSSNYRLGIKWPAYWQYLELLPETKFLVCIRHPLEVINSYKKAGGRLAQGLEYDTAFNRRLNQELQTATRNPTLRRILFFEAIHNQMLPFLTAPTVFVVRYECWFTELERLLAELSDFLDIQLEADHVAIRPPKSRSLDLSPQEIDLIKQYCHTAEPLGYDLNTLIEY